MNAFIRQRIVALVLASALFLLAALAATVMSLHAFDRLSDDLYSAVALDLRTLATLRHEGIEATLRERIGDARLLAGSAAIRELLDPALDPARRAQIENDATATFGQMQGAYGYGRIALFGADLHPLVPGDMQLGAETEATMLAALRARQPQFVAFHRVGDDPFVYGIAVPVRRAGAEPDAAAAGVIYLETHAGGVMAAIDAPLPPGHEDVRLLLLHRMPQGVVSMIVTPVHVPGDGSGLPEATIAPGMTRFHALSEQDDATVRAVAAEDHLVEGLSPTGTEPVMMLAARILDTDWFLAAETERALVNREVRREGWRVGGVAGIALLILALFGVFFWQRWSQLLVRREAEMAQRYAEAVRNMADGFLRLDETGTIHEANEAAAIITGYTTAELVGMRLPDLMEAPAAARSLSPTAMALDREGKVRFRTRWRRRDKVVIDVDGAITAVGQGGMRHEHLVVRDITADIQTQQRLSRLNNLHIFLQHLHDAIEGLETEEDILRQVTRCPLIDPHIALLWTGMVDEANRMVRVMGATGRAADYAGQLVISLDPELPTSQGPSAQTVLRARMVVGQSLQADTVMAPWHDALVQHGLFSSASLPLYTGGRVRGLVCVYADVEGFFEPDVLGLLNDMAHVISSALQAAAGRREVREAEQALRQRENIYSAIVEQAADAIGLLDAETGYFTEFNEAAHRNLGYTREEFAHLRLADFSTTLGPDFRAQLAELLDQPHAVFEAGHRRRDGEVRTVRVSFKPIVMTGHLYFAAIWSDITEQSMRNQALAAEIEKHRILFERSPDGLVIADEQGHILNANRRAQEMLGADEATLTGLHVWELTTRYTTQAGWLAIMPQAVAAERPVETQVHRVDGGLFDVEVSWSLAETPAGKLYYSAMRDIAERKRTAQELEQHRHHLEDMINARTAELSSAMVALQASEQRYAYAAEATSDGIWDWDVEADRVECSQAFWRMIGREPRAEAVSDAELVELIHPEDRPLGPAAWAGRGAPGAYEAEYRMRMPDGNWHWLLNRAKVVTRDAAGRPLRLVGTHTDLEARKAAEAALRQARDEAEAANRAKSTFLAIMSHEIRTPLNGVIGMAEVMANEPLAPEQAETVGVIRNSALSLLALIDDILDFSKIEAGRLELELMPVGLVETAESLCSALIPVASARGVDLTLFVDPALPAQVQADPVRLRQIMFNVVGNAVKFSGGRAGRRGRVALRLTPGPGAAPALCITVRDNGIGMNAETQAKLFTPFTQGEYSTTRRFGGSGLGLVITRRLLDLMGGEITLDSIEHEGSCFTMTLPMTALKPPPHLADLAGLRCLLVAGGLVPAEDLAACLGAAGATTEIVADAAAASRAAGPATVVIEQGDVSGVMAPHPTTMPWLRVLRRQQWQASRGEPGERPLDLGWLSAARLSLAVAATARRAPWLMQGAAGPGGGDPGQAEGSGKLILVAEDDRINQQVIRRELAVLGYGCDIARDGAEALEMWRRGDYALVLTDIFMPGMDGYSLAQAIRAAEKPGQHLPILALSANAQHGEGERARDFGITAYLTKPILLNDLRLALATHLANDAPPAIATTALAMPAGMADRAAPLFDAAALPALLGDDAPGIAEMIGEFLASLPGRARSLAAGSLAEQGESAHKLKSAAWAIGAMRLGAAAADLEAAARQGDANEARSAALRLLPILNATEAPLTARLVPSDTASLGVSGL